MPAVSIIIPTRNRAALLPRALQSVVQQTVRDWELIVVDDESDDETALIVRRHLSDSRIRYYRTEHRGVSGARNIGIARARAEWLAFLDSDDQWMPTKLEKQLELLGSNRDKVCHTDEIWMRRGRRVNPMKKHRKPEGWIFAECLPLCVISPSAAIVHRSIFEDLGKFDESYVVCEDYELWLRVSSWYRVALVDEKLVTKFGGHADQLSRRFWGMDRWRVRALYSRLQDSGLYRPWRQAAFDEMKRKVDVLARGCAKRCRKNEALELTDFIDLVSDWWKRGADCRLGLELAPELPALLQC